MPEIHCFLRSADNSSMKRAKIVELVLFTCLIPILHGNESVIPTEYFTQVVNEP